MLITGRQIAAARSLLNVSQDDLAKKAGVGRVTIARFENGDSEPRDNILEALKTTIENMGIEFIHGGVIPRRSSIKQIFGSDCFVKLLEMICYELNKGDEALFICSYENLSPPPVVNMLRQIRAKGIKMRSLTGEDNTYLMGELKEYKYLPEEYAHSETLVVFSDFIASPLQGQEKSVVIIEDKAASNSLRNLFNFIWSVTKTPKEITANERY